ncbi:MAG: DoxX family protein [Verrucomicrobiota bacterium]|nr:DoxX family protein [Verrucomicrobiota bacterium]
MFNIDGFRPDAMDAIMGPIFQVSIILGIIYAWTLGFNRLSKFRAGNAKTMSEEFLVYGLPEWSLYVIGGIKLTLACLMILGFFLPYFVKPIAGLICLVMGAAVILHLKIREDSLLKAFPSYYIFCCSFFLLID